MKSAVFIDASGCLRSSKQEGKKKTHLTPHTALKQRRYIFAKSKLLSYDCGHRWPLFFCLNYSNLFLCVIANALHKNQAFTYRPNIGQFHAQKDNGRGKYMRKMKIFLHYQKMCNTLTRRNKRETKTRIKLPDSVDLMNLLRVVCCVFFFFAHRFSLRSSRFLFINILHDYLCQRRTAERQTFSVWKWAIKVVRILSCACKENKNKNQCKKRWYKWTATISLSHFIKTKIDPMRMKEVEKYDWSGHSRVYNIANFTPYANLNGNFYANQVFQWTFCSDFLCGSELFW